MRTPHDDLVAEALADDSEWSVVTTRFADPLDILAQVAPEEPFVQEMLAQRDRITVALANGNSVVAASADVAGHRFFVPELHFVVPFTDLDVTIEAKIGHSSIQLPLRITGGIS